jgi:hypothetical protein
LEYDQIEYGGLPVNVSKPGILLCANGVDAYPALSRTGTTTIAVAIRYRPHERPNVRNQSISGYSVAGASGASTVRLMGRCSSGDGREVKKCNEIETEILVIVDGRPMGDAAR